MDIKIIRVVHHSTKTKKRQNMNQTNMKQTVQKCGMVAMLCLAAIGAPKSAAVSLDLTGLVPPVPDPLEGVINGAIFRAADAGAGGSGVFNPFVRLEDKSKPKDGVAEGYNASARPVMDDVNTSPVFTRDIKLSEFGSITLAGVDYYELRLDINQATAKPLLSLDNLMIYTRNAALTNASTLGDLQAGPSVLRYSLDLGEDSEILLNDNRIGSGSGEADMFAFIPQSLFAGASDSDYVYLFSQFGKKGGDYEDNAGFQEWGTSDSNGTVPEGGRWLMVFGMVMTGLASGRRWLQPTLSPLS